jgi:hypothetical protein
VGYAEIVQVDSSRQQLVKEPGRLYFC